MCDKLTCSRLKWLYRLPYSDHSKPGKAIMFVRCTNFSLTVPERNHYGPLVPQSEE
jgi:hypothetical protein